MEEKKHAGMGFGRRYRAGNFIVEKITKSLGKHQQKELRAEYLKKGVKFTGRAGIPFIRVSTLSSDWQIDFAFNHGVYDMVDSFCGGGEELSAESQVALASLFSMWYADTSIIGDASYINAKMEALDGFLKRQATDNDDAEDEKALDEVRKKMQAEADIENLASDINNETKTNDDGKQYE